MVRGEARSRSSRSAGWRAAARTSARPGRGPRPRRSVASSSSTSRPTWARSTAKPRCRRPLSTAWPCGSRMPAFGRTSTVALIRARPRVGEVVGELDPGQPLERLDVARARAVDDVGRELRAGVGLVPAERLAVVADELLVERRLRAAGLVLVGGPEAGRVRRERLVGEDEPPVAVDAELELRVGEDDPALEGALGDEPVELERQLARPRRKRSSPTSATAAARSMFSSWPVCAFVAGVKIGSGSRSDSTRPGGRPCPQTSPVAR